MSTIHAWAVTATIDLNEVDDGGLEAVLAEAREQVIEFDPHARVAGLAINAEGDARVTVIGAYAACDRFARMHSPDSTIIPVVIEVDR